MLTDKYIKRFWDKVDTSGDCWEWIASCDSNGYGHMFVNEHIRQSHRLSWEISNGKIPDGMYVCHHCDNPKCVNPSHLFLGSNGDNVRDAFNKGRKCHKGEDNPNSILTWYIVNAIRSGFDNIDNGNKTHYIKSTAKKYGVSIGCIRDIIYKAKWV